MRKFIGMQNGVSQFKILIVPKSITLPKKTKSFALYLEKGMQIIGRYQNKQALTSKDSLYRFRNCHSTEFRINNLSNASYAWALYSLNEQTRAEHLQDSVSFNLQNTIKSYQQELLEKERGIQTSLVLKSIDKNTILDVWARTKKDMERCKNQQKCIFPRGGFKIEFDIEIKNKLDIQIEKAQQAQQKSKLKRIQSDDCISFSSQQKKKGGSEEKAKETNDTNYKVIIKPEDIQTKQTAYPWTTTMQNQKKDAEEDFNATVKIVSPCGQEIDAKEHQQRALKQQIENNSCQGSIQGATKKFSLLSDIIQLSFEGSSSYGHREASNSIGPRLDLFKKDTRLDLVVENKEAVPLNKFRTLPHESIKQLEADGLIRRALTAEKEISEVGSSQIHESMITMNEKSAVNEFKSEIPSKVALPPSSGDPYGKWIILAAFIIILMVVGGVWNEASHKKLKNRKKLN